VLNPYVSPHRRQDGLIWAEKRTFHITHVKTSPSWAEKRTFTSQTSNAHERVTFRGNAAAAPPLVGVPHEGVDDVRRVRAYGGEVVQATSTAEPCRYTPAYRA
jgi:hypothetical protein